MQKMLKSALRTILFAFEENKHLLRSKHQLAVNCTLRIYSCPIWFKVLTGCKKHSTLLKFLLCSWASQNWHQWVISHQAVKPETTSTIHLGRCNKDRQTGHVIPPASRWIHHAVQSLDGAAGNMITLHGQVCNFIPRIPHTQTAGRPPHTTKVQ